MKNEVNKIAKDTNYFLKKFINNQNSSYLINAMKYCLFPGGK
jgi:farnesyl diphosphate synthase